MKLRLMFENYKNCLLNDEVILRSQQRFQSDHEVYTEEVNKVALGSRDNKRLQTSNKIETYSHGKNVFKACER